MNNLLHTKTLRVRIRDQHAKVSNAMAFAVNHGLELLQRDRPSVHAVSVAIWSRSYFACNAGGTYADFAQK